MKSWHANCINHVAQGTPVTEHYVRIELWVFFRFADIVNETPISMRCWKSGRSAEAGAPAMIQEMEDAGGGSLELRACFSGKETASCRGFKQQANNDSKQTEWQESGTGSAQR